uniref:DNA helicase n=1 Tax=Caenorhabditis elegans TaxID=6239 RepID=Q7K7J6_CAEEL|eukprot:NP_001022417.1 DNA helicase [Caenorhabditis elegans]
MADRANNDDDVDRQPLPIADDADDDVDGIDEMFNNEDEDPEDEEGENLFGDDMERDYREQPELDQYSESGMDDASDVGSLSIRERRRLCRSDSCHVGIVCEHPKSLNHAYDEEDILSSFDRESFG